MRDVHPPGMPMRKRVFLGLGVNVGLLSFLLILVALMKSPESLFLRFGPSDELRVISVHINTWPRYVGLMVVLAFISGAQVFVEDFASPVLAFAIFDPNRLHITMFSKRELIVSSIVMSSIDGVRGVLMILVSISQVDVALAGVVFRELTSTYTTTAVLHRKTFGPSLEIENDFEMFEPRPRDDAPEDDCPV